MFTKPGKHLPQEHKECASLNIYPHAHKSRNRVYPGCASIKGLQNPKSNCWMNSVLQVVCGSSFFDLLSYSLTESNDNLFQQLYNVRALLCENDGKKSVPFSRFQKIGSLVNMEPR